MNINNLPITDDLQEQIAYGKELMEAYDEKMLNYIKGLYASVEDWEKRFPISREEMLCKATYDYWMYGFTPEQQIYFHLWGKTHEEKWGYMTQRSSLIYYARLNAKEGMQLLEDKYEAYKYLKPYYKREIIKIASEEDYPLFLDFISRHPQFVLKPVGLHDTKGVRKVDMAEEGDPKALFDSMINVGENYANDYSMEWSNLKTAVLEEIIEQDPEYGALSPKSLNGVRIPTIRVNGKIHVYGCWMKIGVSDELIVGESRNDIMCGIDAETGVFDTCGYFENGDTIECHPVCGTKLKGWQVPKWQELLEFIKEVANTLPETCNYASWDACLTPKGWVIVEGNYYGQALWQLVHEKGSAQEFGDLIGWHMEEGKPWWKYKMKQVERSAGLIK